MNAFAHFRISPLLRLPGEHGVHAEANGDERAELAEGDDADSGGGVTPLVR